MSIGTEKRNDKVETKKPEIIQDCNIIMLGVEGAEQILLYCPCSKITLK
jgi:hypothetical protein